MLPSFPIAKPIAMKKIFLLACFVLAAVLVRAQLLRWNPAFPTIDGAVTITLDATKGNLALKDYSNPDDIYLHIGVITNVSQNSGDWQHSVFPWGSTPPAGKATYLGNNQYSFTIPNIRTFFSVGQSETASHIALLFRNGSGSVVHRNADQSDMYIPLAGSSLAVRFSQPPFQPTYIPVPEPLTVALNDVLPVTAVSNQPASLRLYHNGTLVASAANATTLSHNLSFTAGGNQSIFIEAGEGAAVVKDSVKFFVAGGVTIAPLPAGTRPGINYLNNSSAVLVLEAPGKNRVSVIGEFPASNWTEQPAFQMNKTADGRHWWLRLENLTAGTEYAYQYLVDGSLKIADPYATKILDPWNDPYITPATYPALRSYPAGQSGIVSLLQTGAPAFTWTSTNFSRPDKRNLIIFELLLRDFIEKHDWSTLRDTISYLKRLGINAIELLPFNEFEGNESWGYNPDFYFAPDKYYGPAIELKRFIDACHSNGIAVIMDIALNHSFGLAPMVQLYWDGLNNRPSADNPWFNPTPRHPFNVGYDMNHESEATKYYFNRITDYWLKEYRIDGFRFDLSKGFTQRNSCTTANCETGNEVGNWSSYDASRVAIWKRYYDSLQVSSPESYVILEHLGVNDEERELAEYGMMLWGNMNYNFNEASMGWLDNSDLSGALHTTRQWSKPHLISYMESHDEERIVFKNINYGNSSGGYNVKDSATAIARSGLAATFLLTMPGPKMMWQFGETGYDYSINYCINNGSIDPSCRTGNKPIRWDYRSRQPRQQLENVYKILGGLRSNPGYKDLFTASGIQMESSLGGAMKWMKLRSTADTANLCVIGNFDVAQRSVGFMFPVAGDWTELFSGSTFAATGLVQQIMLAPGEYRVYMKKQSPDGNPPIPTEGLGIKFGPNPANASSVLQLSMASSGHADVFLFNSQGQRVRVLFTGTLASGVNTLTVSDKINNLAAGLYFISVYALNQQSRVPILVK